MCYERKGQWDPVLRQEKDPTWAEKEVKDESMSQRVDQRRYFNHVL